MSATAETKTTPETPAKPKKGLPAPVGWVITAILAGGAAFGGTRAAVKVVVHAEQHKDEHHEEAKPPGLTVALDPFLVNIQDENKKTHPMKITLAIEFDAKATEDKVKPFTPRIRDAMLGHMRTLTFEEATDSRSDKLRADLLESCKKVGASSAERVLITDMVAQ